VRKKGRALLQVTTTVIMSVTEKRQGKHLSGCPVDRTGVGHVPLQLVRIWDRLCGLVVRIPGYRSGGLGFDSWHGKKVVGLERGPLSLVSTSEELLGINSSGSGLERREYGRRNPSR
jgi:hypothetical protein